METEVKLVELQTTDNTKQELGAFIRIYDQYDNDDLWFAIINALAQHLGFVPKGNKNFFVLEEKELDAINHVEFNLSIDIRNKKWVVDGIGDKLEDEFFNELCEDLYPKAFQQENDGVVYVN